MFENLSNRDELGPPSEGPKEELQLTDGQALPRDREGGERDRLADDRDREAERRDREAERRDAAADRAGESVAAALARENAASDRREAANDRKAAALERDRAARDRTAAAIEREHASFDALTGAYLRGPGMAQLRREVARALRTQQPLAIAFVDVVGLRSVNNSCGHAAGDRLLRRVADTLRSQLRAYDLVIRYGGDEFVCLFSGMDVESASSRCALVNARLAQGPEPGSIGVGIAQLGEGDSLEMLIAKADAAFYTGRALRGRLGP